jgi:hypothetical protein
MTKADDRLTEKMGKHLDDRLNMFLQCMPPWRPKTPIKRLELFFAKDLIRDLETEGVDVQPTWRELALEVLQPVVVEPLVFGDKSLAKYARKKCVTKAAALGLVPQPTKSRRKGTK